MDSLAFLAQAVADVPPAAADYPGQFNKLSWGVIVFYLIFTTWLGHKLSGKQATIKDFFLGGRKLPWYAVSGSIIATELSAMTLVGAPAFLWSQTGDMTYAILAIGNILARIIVGFWFIPKFYEQEIYSPYDYIGNQLGPTANRTTSYLFMLGGIMGQGTRVLLTAVVLEVVTGMDIYWSIWIVGIVSVLWTYIGGITTVIWTDVILFCIFTFSALLTLYVVEVKFPAAEGKSTIASIINVAIQEGRTMGAEWEGWGKFRFWDADFDLAKNYTIWASLIGATIVGCAAYGTDQMMAQRAFCCKNEKDARKAMIVSSVSQLLMLVCLLVGVALWAFYKKSGLEGVPNAWEEYQINENANRLLPVFIKFHVHWFLGGLVVAGIFAAAISSLDSILAALSQQTLAAVHRSRGLKESIDHIGDIRLSRIFIIVWAFVLCGMATVFQMMASNATLLIELALGVVGYVQGAILGIFLLALVPALRVKSRGLEICAAFSVLSVLAITRHGEFVTFWFIVLSLAGLAAIAFVELLPRDGLVFIKLLPFMALIIFLHIYTYVDAEGATKYLQIGWPYYGVLGFIVMVSSALIICEPLKAKHDPEAQAAAG